MENFMAFFWILGIAIPLVSGHRPEARNLQAKT
jgi:hypothetical protein